MVVYDYIYFYDYTTSLYSRNQTTFNQTINPQGRFISKFFDLKNVTVGGDLYYYDHVASAEPSTAEQLVGAGTTTGSHYIRQISAFPFNEYTDLIKAYATNTGSPNFAGTLAGTWTFYLECMSIINSSQGGLIFCKIYKRSAGSVNTLMGTSTQSAVSTSQAIQQTTWNSAGSTIATDRLYVEVWGTLLAEAGTPL